MILEIAQLILALATLIGSGTAAYVAVKTRSDVKTQGAVIVATGARVEAQAAVIETLEKNTNSIKDALVKVTGEKEHAAGVIVGREEVKAEQKAGSESK